MKTNAANDKNVYLPAGRKIKISDYYEFLDNWPVASIEPEAFFVCMENIKSWIKSQEVIRGCVMNFADRGLLEMMCDRSKTWDTRIVINYNKDLPKDAYMAHFYPKIRSEGDAVEVIFGEDSDQPIGSKDVVDFCGIRVFHHHKEGDRYPCLMHHKFLIGWEDGEDDRTRTMLYGSFNMSYASPKSLDSNLLFRQNQRLIDQFLGLHKILFDVSHDWEMLASIGFDLSKAQSLKQYVYSLDAEALSSTKSKKEWDELLSDLRGDGNLSHERTSDEEKVIRDYLWSQGPWI